MVQITIEVSDLVAKFLNEKYCEDWFGETPGETIEGAIRDALKLWADLTLEEQLKIFEEDELEAKD